MKTRGKVIIGVLGACLAVAAGIWMEVRTCRRMRAAVEQALEMNRTYVPFTSDTIYLNGDSSNAVTLRRAVAYYNSPRWRFFNTIRHLFVSPLYGRKATGRRALLGNGGGGEALRAGYALGCVYRDLHEAPIAIITWEDAVAAADTTADDCDYATVYRVYGQMADMYFRQYMPEKELEAREKFNQYSLLAGDTLNYIRGLLLRNDAFLSLGDTAAVFDNIEHVRQLYLERGLTHEAAQVYPSAIHIALDRGQYEKADTMMQIFEKESGLFDEHGNIERTREIYYYHKGSYFIGTHQLDSAEVQFRRLLKYEPNHIDAYRGFLRLYEQKKESDSIFKYARLYEKILDRYLEDTHTYAITQAKGLYDYNRQHSIAQKQKNKARRRGVGIVIITSIAFVLFTSLSVYYRRRRYRDRRALISARDSYIKAKNELSKLQQEVNYLKENLPTQKETEDLLNEKETLRQKLLSQIASSLAEMGIDNSYEKDDASLMKSEIVQLFKQIAYPHTVKENGKVWQESSRPFTDDEWEELVAAIQKYHYGLYYFITAKHKLPKRQFKVCILSRLSFGNQEIAVLMNTSFSNISNLRSKVAYTLFGMKDLSLLDELLPQI